MMTTMIMARHETSDKICVCFCQRARRICWGSYYSALDNISFCCCFCLLAYVHPSTTKANYGGTRGCHKNQTKLPRKNIRRQQLFRCSAPCHFRSSNKEHMYLPRYIYCSSFSCAVTTWGSTSLTPTQLASPLTPVAIAPHRATVGRYSNSRCLNYDPFFRHVSLNNSAHPFLRPAFTKPSQSYTA